MRFPVRLFAFILIVLLCPQPLVAAGGQPLLLLYSNDVRGETAPCG